MPRTAAPIRVHRVPEDDDDDDGDRRRHHLHRSREQAA
jgi:hypothetical protein